MEIGDWRSTRELNPIFRQIRDLGLESNLAELEAFGFTVIEPELLGSADFADRLRAAALNLEASQDPMVVKTYALDDRPAAGRQLFHILDKDPVFCEAMMHPAVLAMAKYLVGESCRVSSTIIFTKHGPASPTYVHCDSLAVPPPLPYFPAVCNVSWILSDYSEENGTFFMVPGSHRYCRHPTPNDQPAFLGGPENNDLGIPVNAKPGSLLVFGGNMWHGAYPKKDAGGRVHVAYFFCRNYVNPSEDFADFPDDDIEKYGPDFANLLGPERMAGLRDRGARPRSSQSSRASYDQFERINFLVSITACEGEMEMRNRAIVCASTGVIGIVALGIVGAAIAATASGGDPRAGKLVFAKCAACHTMDVGQNRSGPSLAGVVGRKVGMAPNYNYSSAMKASGVVWTARELDAFLANPRNRMPGSKMFFAGLPKPEDRANVIAYMAKPK